MTGPTARRLALLALLQTRRERSGRELAERLGVTQRTIRTDVDRLRELGYPVHARRGNVGGYRLGAGGTLPPRHPAAGQSMSDRGKTRAAVL